MDNIAKHITFNQKSVTKKEDNTPLVSAVVSTYKRDTSMVKRAVMSILNQTYRNMELIVVNDYPADVILTEKIEEMLSTIQTEMEIHYIVVDKNGGACKARNIGIRQAKGKYVACLDDDDEWKPEKIQIYLEAAEKDPKIGIVYGGVITKNEKSGIEKRSDVMNLSGDIFMQELAFNWVGSCSFPLLRKSVINSVGGFREDMPALQDWELFLRMLKKCHAVYIPEPLNIYYIYEGERISANSMKRVEAYEKLHAEYTEELKKDRSTAASFYMMGCYFYGLNLDIKKGFYYWWKAVIKNPFNIKKNILEFIKLLGRPVKQSKNL
jgi:glycosyltransferase involved in cell wall biosynthesis